MLFCINLKFFVILETLYITQNNNNLVYKVVKIFECLFCVKNILRNFRKNFSPNGRQKRVTIMVGE